MKRKILFVVLAGFLLSGIASAASLWGTYKGNPIIRITVDGVPVQVSDVPAINYNNRTMIPVYLLKEAGLEYTWDGKNQTVDIKRPRTEIIQSTNTEQIVKIKALFLAADYYKKTESMGSLIDALGEILDSTYEDVLYGNGEFLDMAKGYLNSTEKGYKEHENYFNSINPLLTAQSIFIKDKSDQIMKYYKDAIESYKEAFNYLVDYSRYGLDSDFRSYLEKSSEGFDLALDGKAIAMQEYNYYSNLIFNFQ